MAVGGGLPWPAELYPRPHSAARLQASCFVRLAVPAVMLKRLRLSEKSENAAPLALSFRPVSEKSDGYRGGHETSGGMDKWGGYHEWHRLLDRVCSQKGYRDNSDLAAAFCARTGRIRQQDFDAAKRKLREWRTGKRLPRRTNFRAISTILGVDGQPDLQRHWNRLYLEACRHGRTAAGDMKAPGKAASPVILYRVASGMLVLLSVGLASLATERQRAPTRLPEVGYEAYVRVPVGVTRLIHGEHDDCKGPPPPWEDVSGRLPQTGLGTFADGGLARQVVRACGREVVVRAVMFTGTAIGVEELYVLDDYIKIEVPSVSVEFSGDFGR